MKDCSTCLCVKSWEDEEVDNKIVNRIMDFDKWPNLQLPENLQLLNELADESFSTQTVSGMLASTLMYHQIIEAMCLHLLENCHFQIQLAVYPAMIDFSIKENKMLGRYVQELTNSITFHKKDDFIKKVTEFNDIRNDLIHKMRKNNPKTIIEKAKDIKQIFDEVFELYDEIQDDFRVVFHSFKKDIFIDEDEE